jgi:hypothetical protein
MKMCKRSKTHRGGGFISAAFPGPKPGDFPIGSLRSRSAARAILIASAEGLRKEREAMLESLTPYEQVLIEDESNPGVRILMIRLLRGAQQREKAYGMVLPWPSPEQIRHNRAVFKEIDRMTCGDAAALFTSNSIKWNQLKAVAEENLRRNTK